LTLKVREMDEVLARIPAWANGRADVRAVVLVGSRARTESPADEWSDADLLLFLDDPAPYADDAGWLGAFGRAVLTFLEPTGVGDFTERRVLFESGAEVDFALLPAEILAGELPAELVSVAGRGFRALYDTVGLAPRLAAATGGGPLPEPAPSAADFAQLSNDFWYHVLWSAKKLRRGELWVAKQGCDGYLKTLLVRLLGWHARAAEPGLDTWHRGRFLERWADPAALAVLPGTYASYDPVDVGRALRATADLFERVEREFGARSGLPLAVPHADVRARLDQLLG
jgi:aminoglycoside 6-adenylyltransferase